MKAMLTVPQPLELTNPSCVSSRRIAQRDSGFFGFSYTFHSVKSR